MTCIELPYGRKQIELVLPEDWLGWVAKPSEAKPAQDSSSRIQAALQAPIGSSRLRDLAHEGMKTTIILDDITRKTPVQQILPFVLEELHQAGLSNHDIHLVIALGSHRRMTPAEIEAKLGTSIPGEYRLTQCSAEDEQMVYLGQSAGSIPIWIHRAVVEADLRIGIGMITPHLEAGFSGGAKIILPGTCGAATINAFHQASAFIPQNQLGEINAPLRLSLERIVSEKAPLHFIINLVLTIDGKICDCVAGHPIEAHRLGVQSAIQVYGVPCPRRFPIVIANCYPYDQDLWQSLKGIYCGEKITEDDGTLIVLTAAEEACSTYPLLPREIGREPEDMLKELQQSISQDPKQTATGVMVARLRRRIHLVLVSEGLTSEEAGLMKIPLFRSVEEAVADSISKLPLSRRSFSLAVLPQAGILLPILAG